MGRLTDQLNQQNQPTGGRLSRLNALKPPPTPPQPSFGAKIWGGVKAVGNALTSSEQTLGRGLSTVGSNIPQQQADQAAKNTENVVKLLKVYHDSKDPIQKQHLANTLKFLGTDVTATDINPAFGLSDKQVIGAAAGTLMDVAMAGSYGKATQSAKSFSLAKPVVKTVEQIAAEKVLQSGKTFGQKIVGSATKVAKGAMTGYGYDVAGNLQADKSNGYLPSAKNLTPGLGTIVGGGIPLAIETAKGLGYVAKEVAKHTASTLSGVPKGAIEEAFNNPDKVQAALRKAATDGEGATQRIYQNAVDALDNIKTVRNNAYKQGLAKLEKEATYTKGGQLYVKRVLTGAEANLKGYVPGTKIGVPTNLSTSGIKKVFTTTVKDFGAEGGGLKGLDFTNVALDESHIGKLQKLQERIYKWSDATPTGINRLKQVIASYRVGGINLGSSENKFNAIITGLKTNLFSYLGERVPQIAEMNRQYTAESKVIDNIVGQLKIGRGDPNTALRKLLNAFNPKSEMYRPVVEQLGEKGAKSLMADIAGLTMSKLTPEGIAKYFDTVLGSAGATVGILNPKTLLATIPAMAMASPRIVGEMVTGAGKIAQNKTAQAIGEAAIKTGNVTKKLITRYTGLTK